MDVLLWLGAVYISTLQMSKVHSLPLDAELRVGRRRAALGTWGRLHWTAHWAEEPHSSKADLHQCRRSWLCVSSWKWRLCFQHLFESVNFNFLILLTKPQMCHNYRYTQCDKDKRLNVRGVTIALWYFISKGHQAWTVPQRWYWEITSRFSDCRHVTILLQNLPWQVIVMARIDGAVQNEPDRVYTWCDSLNLFLLMSVVQ